MKLRQASPLEPVEILYNGQVLICEICRSSLSGMVFVYRFNDDAVITAQICDECYLSAESDHDIALNLIRHDLLRLEVEIILLDETLLRLGLSLN